LFIYCLNKTEIKNMQIPSVENDIKGLAWVGGPTHHIQNQHIPGYCGHVRGLKAESLLGAPFAKLTAKSLNNQIEKGFIIEEKDRFKTTTGDAYKSYYQSSTKDPFKLSAENILRATKTSYE
jgi:hypothetical protein